jgi:Tfp pilus assembly protein PilE
MVKAVTLLEMSIVLVICTLVLAFAMPSYTKYIERTKGKRAELNLSTIYNMQKRKKFDQGVYYECAKAPCSSYKDSSGNQYYFCPSKSGCTQDLINDALDISLVDPHFDYKIEIEGTQGGYKCIATRKSGPCTGKTMTVTSYNKKAVKGCELW